MVTQTAQQRLESLLRTRDGTLYIALSGGIDSITLMTVAARVRSAPTIAVHAVSEAVPAEATARCRELAAQRGWHLRVLNAGEFSDQRYIDNPVNRCYYCKTNLFSRITDQIEVQSATIATGTNLDDLGDYRPGLIAASENAVWQPFAEAGVDKATIRQIARSENLAELSELPAQPCLSSRVETGIAINGADLLFAHRIERRLASEIGDGDIRCRITADGIVAQLPADTPAFVDPQQMARLESLLRELCQKDNRQLDRIEPYRMGSAFLRATNE